MAEISKHSFLGVGVMTGTSLDGIDLVCCKFEYEKGEYSFSVVASQAIPIKESWKNRLHHLPRQSAEVLAKTHVYFGHYLGESIAAFIETLEETPDFVACHGQTIFHQPHRSFTTQIGDGETIASYLHCPLITNFRNKDVALKGQGAPLVPIGEKYLFPDHELFLNLGGICNLTWNGLAFDVTACNLVLNTIYKEFFEGEYDVSGEKASSGQLDPELADALNQLAYYRTPPPKSLGWEWVEQEMLPVVFQSKAAAEDLLYTVTRHIAAQIARALTKLETGPQQLMITGGGRYHQFLIDCLEESLKPLEITIDQGISNEWVEFKEAIIFAFLGLRVMENKPTTLASVTGATQDVMTGSIHLPPNGGWKLVKV